MARQRVQVQGSLGPERLRPAASPVDRFVTPAPSRLGQLAEGLARFAPELSRFAETVQTQQDQEKMLEGAQYAQELLDSQKTYRQAVKEGLIHRSQNPWFRLGMKKRFANVAAGSYIATLSQRAKEWAENSTNPEDFGRLESELRKQWMEENLGDEGVDAFFSQVFSETVNSQAAGIARNFALVAGENAVQQSLDLVGAEAFDILADDSLSLEDRIQRLRDLDAEATQEMLLPGNKVTDAIAKAVIDTAIQQKDYELLGVRMKPDGTMEFTGEGILHKLKSGTAPMGNIPRIRDQIREAAWQITQSIEAEWAHADRAEQRRRSEARRTVAENFAMAEDPFAPEFLEAQAQVFVQAGFPDMAQEIRQIGQANQTLMGEGDERYVDDLRAGILMGDFGIERLFRAARNGDISGRQLQSLMGTYSSYLQYQTAVQEDGIDPMEHDYWKDGEAFVQKLAAGGLLTNLSSIGAVEARRALTWARKRWLHWWYNLGGKDASPEEQRDELDRIFEATREQFFQDQMITDEQRARLEATDPLNTDWQNQRVLSLADTQELVAVVLRAQEVPSEMLAYKLYRMGIESPALWGQVAAAQARHWGIPIFGQTQNQPQPAQETPQETPEEPEEAPITVNEEQAARIAELGGEVGIWAQRLIAGTARPQAVVESARKAIEQGERAQQRLAFYEEEGIDLDTLEGARARRIENLREAVRIAEALRTILGI